MDSIFSGFVVILILTTAVLTLYSAYTLKRLARNLSSIHAAFVDTVKRFGRMEAESSKSLGEINQKLNKLEKAAEANATELSHIKSLLDDIYEKVDRIETKTTEEQARKFLKIKQICKQNG